LFQSRIFSATKYFALLLHDALKELRQHEPLQIAGATSFFAVFALPPMLIILAEAFGVFGSTWSIRQDLLQQLSFSIDRNTVTQVSRTVSNVWRLPLGSLMQVAVFLFLLFVATTFFAVIKASLNQLWSVSLKKNTGFYFTLMQRVKFLGAIIFAGILVYVILTVEKQAPLLSGHLLLKRWLYNGSSMLASMGWFVVVFRFLADGRPGWKESVAGGVLAGLFFTIGKSALRLLLSYNKVHTIYGASTAMVMLLLFVFYSALIFYYCASFVKVLSDRETHPIRPTAHARKYVVKQVRQYE
jgi:membrane protein